MRRKILPLFSVLLGTSVCVPLFSSCAQGGGDVPKSHYEISVSPEHSFGFSNYTISHDPYVDYQIDIDGTIDDGDILETIITEQNSDGKSCHLIRIDDKFKIIKINKTTKHVTVRIRKELLAENNFFWVCFSLKFILIRDGETIYTTVLNKMSFINGTPTEPEMFNTTDVEGQTTLTGWNPESWVQEKLQYCNVLVLPTNIDVVAQRSFSISNKTSTIPSNFEALICDILYFQTDLPSTTITIQEEAFLNAPFRRIYLTPNIVEIKDDVFKNNYSLRIIDVSKFDEIPTWSGWNIFGNIEYEEQDKGIVYHKASCVKQYWIDFFTVSEGPASNLLKWEYVSIN